MRTLYTIAVSVAFLLWWGTAFAADVELPAPVLEWSFYILLIFAFFVAIGIFFSRGKNGKNEMLSGLLDRENANIHTVSPDISVTECVRQMNEHRIGAMLVMEGERLAGIFTERDAMTGVLGAGLDPADTLISEVMTRDPIVVSPETTLDEAMGIVTHERVRHLPVLKDGHVLGVVSSGDLTHRLVRDKPGDIRELVDIAGKRKG